MHADNAVKHIIRVMSVVALVLGLLVGLYALGVDSFDIYLILFVAIGGVCFWLGYEALLLIKSFFSARQNERGIIDTYRELVGEINSAAADRREGGPKPRDISIEAMQRVKARRRPKPKKARFKIPVVATFSKPQKIGSWILLGIMTSALIPFLLMPNFAPAPQVSGVAIYLSAGLTLASMATVEYLYHRGRWRIPPALYSSSALKHYLIKVPAVALFLFSLFWLNLAYSLPQLYTSMAHRTVIEQGVVVKNRRSGRGSWCRYRLEPHPDAGFPFRYCIDRVSYEALPAGKIKARLVIKRSPLGIIVSSIEPQTPE